MYQHDPPGASGFDAPYRRFAGAQLEDLLTARALECFAYGWSLSDVQDRVAEWNVFKAKPGAFLDDAAVEAIVERAARLAPAIPTNAHEVLPNVVSLDSYRETTRTNIRKVVIRRD